MLIEKDKLVSEEPESDKIMNINFTNITKNVKTLSIPLWFKWNIISKTTQVFLRLHLLKTQKMI